MHTISRFEAVARTLEAQKPGAVIRSGVVESFDSIGRDFEQVKAQLDRAANRVEFGPCKELLNTQLLMHRTAVKIEFLSKISDAVSGGIRRLQQG